MWNIPITITLIVAITIGIIILAGMITDGNNNTWESIFETIYNSSTRKKEIELQMMQEETKQMMEKTKQMHLEAEKNLEDVNF